MKKSLTLLSIIPALLLAGCNSSIVDTSKIALDRGDIYSHNMSFDDFKYLSYEELEAEVINKNSFVLITTTEFDNSGCGCWTDFVKCFIPFANKYHYNFKILHISTLEGHSKKFGIWGVNGMMPGICFFRRGKLIRQAVYGKNAENNRKMFKQPTVFETFMLDNIYLPKVYYLDAESLDTKIASNEQFNLYVGRSGCKDCKYIEEEYVRTWIEKEKETTISDYLFAFDIEKYRPTVPKDDPRYDEQYGEYCKIKNKYGLSVAGNASLGYDDGYVPTFQVWKDGEVYDMITVLNDSMDSEQKLKSFFTAERIQNSPMLQNTGSIYELDGKPLEAKDISHDEYIDDEGVVHTFDYVSRETQYKWHKPIVDLYFANYVK